VLAIEDRTRQTRSRASAEESELVVDAVPAQPEVPHPGRLASRRDDEEGHVSSSVRGREVEGSTVEPPTSAAPAAGEGRSELAYLQRRPCCCLEQDGTVGGMQLEHDSGGHQREVGQRKARDGGSCARCGSTGRAHEREGRGQSPCREQGGELRHRGRGLQLRARSGTKRCSSPPVWPMMSLPLATTPLGSLRQREPLPKAK
jgi:hypothetical protein